MQRSGADKAGSAIRYVVLIGGALVFLLPFYLLVRNGLSTEAEITSPSWKFFPSSPQWGNISDLFHDPAVPMFRSLVNSLVIAVVQTVGVLVISGLAGYGLARIPYRYGNAVFYFIVATLTRTDSDAMVDVNVHHEQTQLAIDVRTGAPPDLTDVQDRVGALNGRLAVNQTPAGDTHLRVELPCA